MRDVGLRSDGDLTPGAAFACVYLFDQTLAMCTRCVTCARVRVQVGSCDVLCGAQAPTAPTVSVLP